MANRRVAKRQALLDALGAVWQEREAALDVLAVKELAAASDPSIDPAMIAEREQFERAQAAVERALKRLQRFEYRYATPPKRRGTRRMPSTDEAHTGRPRKPVLHAAAEMYAVRTFDHRMRHRGRGL